MDQPTNYEPSTSATRPQDQVIHLDGPIVMSRAEILAKQLELNAKRLDLADKQINLANKQLELDEQQRKLDDEQRELNGQSSVSIVFELMASASARTTAIPVVDAPTESISPCPPIAALPSLLVAALPAARPAAAQEGKRPAPINELPESPIVPKRHRGKGQISNAGSMTSSSPITCHRLSEKVAVERLIAALDIPALVAPAAGTATFGNAPAIGVSALDFSALVAPAAGATTFGIAPAAGVLDRDISALIAPAAGATTFGVAPATGILDRDFSALITPAAGTTTFGNAPAIGVPALDFSGLIAPATGAPTFGVAPTAGVLDCDISALVAPAAGASIFGDAPTIGAHAADFSAYVAPVDAAQFAAILNADQPIDRHLATQEWVHRASRNNASESSQVVKRQRLDMCVSDSVTATNSSCMIYDVSGIICDVSGRRVTSERLLVVLGEAPFLSLGYVQDVYRHIYGCALMPSTALPRERIATLASVVALEHWAPQLDEEGSEDIADLSILCRRDLERTELRRSYLEQLGLAEDANAAVLGPRLCFVVVRMCHIPADLLTGPMLSSMFLEVTGLDLHSLNVVTEKGVQRMSAKKLCRLVKKWVGNLVKFIADDGNGLEGSLSVATACNAAYSSKCSSASSDSTEVALSMLRSNKLYSTLFLGNGEAKWGALCRCLVYVSSKRISPRTKECLEQLSTSLQVQSGS
ncbi:hypothetical protein GGF41_002731 [Coemansia sp. RSA 2531]|nr:hypothetical protein GGF41_002731 [Coemansia sp. RSA 2531]